MTVTLILQILTYTFALWFGLYLLARNPRKIGMRYAGLGLVAYALGLGMDTLMSHVPDLAAVMAHWRVLVGVLPLVFWFGAVRPLLPGNARSGLPGRPLALLFAASIFFLLGLAVLLLPQEWLSNEFIVLGIGLDLSLLGYAIVALDAYDEGEALLPDFLRSLCVSAVAALVFGGQIVMVMVITGGATLPLLILLLAMVSTVVALQVFSDAIQVILDRLLFTRLPRLQRERADLRAVSRALPRVNEELDPDTLDDAEFTRLTRRALGHMGDVSRLASNPLTNLSIVNERLIKSGKQTSTLERSAELRALLIESIVRLKPRGDEGFGTSDEWRYYNALYYPYVVGIKPYSRRNPRNGLDPDSEAALEWFRTYVPERTLHNWQNAAARLIAQDLREITNWQ